MLESYHPKIIDKKIFVEYYSNEGLEAFIDDMERVCGASERLHSLEDKSKELKPKELAMYKDLAQKGVTYMLNLPIGKKAKSILTKAADNMTQRKKFQEAYKNTVLVLEEVVNNYKEIYEKAIIFEFVQLRGLY